METRALHLRWEIDAQNVSLAFTTDAGAGHFSASASLVNNLPLLPAAIAADEPVEAVAGAYQNVLRQLHAPGKGSRGPNAMERLSSHIGDRNAAVINVTLSASDGPALRLLGLPWELLLYDHGRDTQGQTLARVAIVRSLGKTSEYAPREIDSQFRVLLLQGASGDPPLDFEAERKALRAAWSSLGMLLNTRMAEPKVFPADVDVLAAHLAAEKPHLLWFSGHGRQTTDDFELLFAEGRDGTWRSVSILSEAIAEAGRRVNQVPLMAAFWACEGARSATPKPSFDSATGNFPVLVNKILSTGVEAVLGVQTQVYDGTARIMGESFFRAVAEGYGPAFALAAARAELHGNASWNAPGGKSEWASPVLWINGAEMPYIKWAYPIESSEALLFHRLGRESVLMFDGGRDILSEDPQAQVSSAAQEWSQRAPIWLFCPELHLAEQKLRIVRSLRQLLLAEKKTVLLVEHDARWDNGVLDAITRSFRSLKRRLFPGRSTEEVDLLVRLFHAFQSDNRQEGWLRLLQQPELVITILAVGSINIDEHLAAARSAAAKVIVIANRSAKNTPGVTPNMSGWQADDLSIGEPSFTADEPTSALLIALATLNKLLTEDAISLFGRDFGLDEVREIVKRFMAQFGDRYVVKASIARHLLQNLDDDESRAAHRACMNLLERVASAVDADYPTQVAWRSVHALNAGEVRIALDLAQDAINRFLDQGDYGRVVEVYNTLQRIRKDLPLEAKTRVAWAQIQMGWSQRAYDLIRQIPVESIRGRSERLRFRVTEAEALRNLHDRNHHEESIAVLQEATREVRGKPTSPTETRWWLIAKHDLARNLHYFRKDAARARTIFLEIVEYCGDDQALAYLKAAALRNLSDIYGKYGYEKVPRDSHLSEDYLREATEIARKNSTAMSLLPELLYLVAKIDHLNGRIQDAAANVREAINLAREAGSGRVLLLSTNKLFWWRFGALTVDNSQSFDYADWKRIEEQLDFTSQDPWIARALVTSRIRAARCLDLQANNFKANEVLLRAKGLLERNSLFHGEADFYKRWQPVFAGLAVLNARPGVATAGHDEQTWSVLRMIGERIVGKANLSLANPEKLWQEVA
jgi:hypothetical protein